MLLVAACGGDGGSIITTTSEGSTTIAAPGAVDTLEGVEGAVIRIVAQGSFVDPFEGALGNVTGGGSGVIIDPSGLAITNNHVVTGAALLEVYVGGSEEPLNARIVGVSECSDLAVIDIAGDGFPFVEWFDGEINAGLGIYAAGHPLGDPEYTLLEGIISKADADGESTWSSVDAVVEHSAETLPGNSGGPLVTEDGQLVGIAYAGNEAGQSFAIGRDVARPVVTQLITGIDVESIGVNGEAFVGETFSGVWVYSVDAGSPADIAGVRGGDLIFELGRLDIGVDGTLAAYCDVLRSHTVTDVLDITVFRAATGEVLAGQLNGRELEVTTTITSGAGELPEGTPYSGYTTITDDSGSITVSVPIEWADIDGGMWDGFPLFESAVGAGPGLAASPDMAAFDAGWDVPGVFIMATTELPGSIDDYLDTFGAAYGATCVYDARYDYDDGMYQGAFDRYDDCGGIGTTMILIVARPPDQSFTVAVDLQLLTQADLDAADEIIATFQVTAPEATAGADYDAYMYTTDDTGAISVSVPVEWSDISGAYIGTPLVSAAGGPMLIASTDRSGLVNDWTTPGFVVGATGELDGLALDDVLDTSTATAFEECTYVGRFDYSIAGLAGRLDQFSGCGGTGAEMLMFFVRPPDEAYTFAGIFVILEERDWGALAEFEGSLTFTPLG